MSGSCALPLLYSMCILLTPWQEAHTLEHPDLMINPEEVHFLSQALLQFGWGLKTAVNQTKESINSIFQQLNIFNISLAKLFQQVAQTAKLGEDLDTKTRRFLGNDTIYQVVTEFYEELATLQTHRAMLDSKIKPLERKMERAVIKQDDSFLNITNILTLIQRQSIRIDALMEIVEVHQELINSQEAKIQRLSKKVIVGLNPINQSGSTKIKNRKSHNGTSGRKIAAITGF